MYRRWIALALCLALMLPAAALAEVTFRPVLDLESSPMQLKLRAEAEMHMPFDEVRTGWINDLLRHMDLTVRFQQIGQEQWIRLQLNVDGETAVDVTQCEDEQSSMAQLSLMPDTTYIAEAGERSALAVLLDQEAEEFSLLGLTPADMNWTRDGEALLHLIREAWADDIVSKSDKQTISGFGSVTRRLTLTIAAADAEEFGAWMAEHCAPGRLADLIGALTFTGKQTLSWYMDQEGRCHKFTYTGNIDHESIDKRRLGITWNMARTATVTKDSLTVKTPQLNEKTAEYNTFTWKRTLTEKNGAVTAKLEYAYTQRLNKQKLVMGGAADLTRTDRDGAEKYTGSITLTRTKPEASEEQLDLTLDLTLDEMDSSVLGTVRVQTEVGKKNREAALLRVDLQPCDNVLWELREKNVYLGSLTAEELGALRQTVSRRLNKAIVRPLVLLPREDTLFFSQELSDEAWQRIVDAAMNGAAAQ